MAPLSDMDMHASALLEGDDQAYAEAVTSSCLPLHAENSRRKNVSFSSDVTTHFVLPLSDFSQQEISSAWYCSEETKKIKQNARDDVGKMIAGQEDSDNFCTRGIESRTREGSRSKRQNKIDARAAVFFEQDMQELDCICDPETIADVYFDYTEHCQVSAYMMALRDRQAAKDALASSKTTDLAGYSHDRVMLNLDGIIGRLTSSAA